MRRKFPEVTKIWAAEKLRLTKTYTDIALTDKVTKRVTWKDDLPDATFCFRLIILHCIFIAIFCMF